MEKIVKTEEQWRQELDPASYEVLRHQATERPFTGRYVNEKGDGVYRCAGCGNELFSSNTKFESGTGWPSFFAPLAKDSVSEIHDSSYGMQRTEIRCASCEAHLGHVFPDGPKPTGQRYCMNGCALSFEAKDEKA
jgi:peptide-methionine (R)-S-oxide reductase